MSTLTGRHVILEGPDGAGKTTLLKYLTEITNLPIHPKFSSSLGGPMDELARLVDYDMQGWWNSLAASPDHRKEWNPCGSLIGSNLFDRHPLISEPIYGLHVRKNIQPEFLTPWFSVAYRDFLAYDPLVIWCLPPFEAITVNVNPDRDMQGVWANMKRMYDCYTLESLRFPGTSMVYDYTLDATEDQRGDIVTAIMRHIDY
ncbi:thymidylate kinase [Streptomyces phage Zuko]|uniref:Thymidylate kinase n=1 Tax=Streptomyces phage Zuko TaxID=2601695 RepID=A0A5J6D7B9_9CAUD|nr:thymidylate kinase [Streptomyces phage Zuko]QEQ93651.1 thymidylate kinase [Streptomyces phage Zuko]